ncbi:hypothetical protein J6590_075502 [Homalodisca vitripennis]|nr:hypothetical protein J6590_075502 [Homalodisca vitripennis]
MACEVTQGCASVAARTVVSRHCLSLSLHRVKRGDPRDPDPPEILRNLMENEQCTALALLSVHYGDRSS